MLFKGKLPPLWLLVFSILASGVGFSMLRSDYFYTTRIYLFIKPLLIPTIVAQLMMFLFSVFFLGIFLGGILYSRKNRLIVDAEGMKLESGYPAWWFINKSACIPWASFESVGIHSNWAGKTVVFKSAAQNIKVSNLFFEDFDGIMEAVKKFSKAR